MRNATRKRREKSPLCLLSVKPAFETPKLVAFSLEKNLVTRPYTIYERAEGALLGHLDIDPTTCQNLYFELGREIAALVAIPVPDQLKPILGADEEPDIPKQIEKCRVADAITADEAKEIETWWREAEPRMAKGNRSAIIHDDLHPWNLFADPSSLELTAIIDWGDTKLGDPASEFASMPLVAIPQLLEGYRSAGGKVNDGFLVRALVLGVSLALWEARGLETSEYDRRWWRLPPGGWAEMRPQLDRLLES